MANASPSPSSSPPATSTSAADAAPAPAGRSGPAAAPAPSSATQASVKKACDNCRLSPRLPPLQWTISPARGLWPVVRRSVDLPGVCLRALTKCSGPELEQTRTGRHRDATPRTRPPPLPLPLPRGALADFQRGSGLRKTRCDLAVPCTNCATRGFECTYATPHRKRGPAGR